MCGQCTVSAQSLPTESTVSAYRANLQNKFRMDSFQLAELIPTIIVVLVILLLGGVY